MLAGTAAHLVFTLGETRYADVYAGQGGGSDAMTIHVYLSRLDPAVERALRAVAGDGASLVFSRVPHPLAWFEALEKKGENREGNVMVAYGLSGVSISPDAADGRLRIDVGSTKGGLMAALDRAYGAKNIEIQRSADSTLTLVEGP